jgi:PadR family transcriptional regulator, regulatory protein PadR
MLRSFLLGVIQIHILHSAAHGTIYGSALIDELRRHGYDLSPGTLYHVLHDLAAEGYLRQEARVVNGRQRKDYTLTAQGQAALDQIRPKIRELVDEVLEAHGPDKLPESSTNAREAESDA